jgi:hypothetical protein
LNMRADEEVRCCHIFFSKEIIQRRRALQNMARKGGVLEGDPGPYSYQ